LGTLSSKSTSELMSVQSALNALLEHFNPLPAEIIPVQKAIGRVTSNDIASPIDLPPFPNSGMDGFAVRAQDTAMASSASPVQLDVIADIPAGSSSNVKVKIRQAARVMTGGLIPSGADAVVPVEDTNVMSRNPGIAAPPIVDIYKPVMASEHIRHQGQDVRIGERVIISGTLIRPQEIGFLSMLGISEISVIRKPRVAVFSTGNELLPVNAVLTSSKIHDANTNMIVSLVEQYGGEALSLGIVTDEIENVKYTLDMAAASMVDMIVSSAGVSVGAFDYVRSVVEEHGKLQFWRVNMRPGKPVAFGIYRNIPFLGLPGNPVSAFTGFEVFGRPALMKMSGLNNFDIPIENVYLLETIESDGRESYLRAVVSRNGEKLMARLTGHQGSGNLHSLVQANALLVIPSGVKSVPAGTRVDAWIIGSMQ